MRFLLMVLFLGTGAWFAESSRSEVRTAAKPLRTPGSQPKQDLAGPGKAKADKPSEEIAAAGPNDARGSADDRIEFFEARIRPVLVEHCYACHNSAKKAAGSLALDHRKGLRQGGDGGKIVVPGKPGQSRLLAILRHGPVSAGGHELARSRSSRCDGQANSASSCFICAHRSATDAGRNS